MTYCGYYFLDHGLGLSEKNKLVIERRKATQNLKMAVFQCLDRPRKIQSANSRSDDNQLDHA